jgi:RNA polymerase sigma factor (sigma-70 family)
MDAKGLNEHLSQISTQWSLLFAAHAGPADSSAEAQRRLLERYAGVVYRYLLGAVRDADTAAELCQEFALRFLRGSFRHANPGRGRFRNYLKTSLVHLVNDYHRARKAQPAFLDSTQLEPAAGPESLDLSLDFAASWREEILDRTWKTFAGNNPTYHAVLALRVENPDLSSTALAEQLTAQLAKPINAARVRKDLQRAREKFADLLVEEIVFSLESDDPEEVEKELRELDLLRYCGSALAKRRKA